ncbi:hypothetical protein OG738_09420 [Amycolatopsis sp. NBC_01488]|uniref:hypothetical protein n=1 Tax=Amycolatopsis sp. NBC_01488 TaxID=2903563 RepID=UPI002E2DDA6F|nr:hypothetical protein [Amycolatopsis sp. NBC_01488]
MTNSDPYPGTDPRWCAPTPLSGPPEAGTPAGNRRWTRIWQVRLACTIVHLICGTFAVVLLARIVLVRQLGDRASGSLWVRGEVIGKKCRPTRYSDRVRDVMGMLRR